VTHVSKHARRGLATFVAASAITAGAVMVPQSALADYGTVSATTALNVRSGPSTSTRVLGVLAAGEQTERRGDPQGEWTPVRFRGQDAWVYSAYTTLGGLTSAAGGTATATDYVNARTGASTLSQTFAVLRIGQQVAVTGSSQGGWVPVNHNGRDGFVYGAYLSFDSSSSTPATSNASTPTSSGTATATTYVNVRTGPSTSQRILGVLATGATVTLRGSSENGWTPVTWNGQSAWISAQYLNFGGGSSGASTAYTTTGVNLRTGPSIDYRIIRVLNTNTQVQLTGVTQDGFSQVSDDGQLRWISTQYLSSSPVSSSGSSGGSAQGPAAPAANGSTSLNTGGSSGLDQLRDTTKQVVYAIRANYPQITTMYGVRSDPLPDHPSGRAVDLMMPNGASDVALGDSVAAYLQANADSLNIEYLIWRQRIWINGSGGWTWMADRGGTTANHYDHVHVTVNY